MKLQDQIHQHLLSRSMNQLSYVSAMFRSRRLLQPRIPRTALEFCEILPTFTEFAVNLKATVIFGDLIGVIFLSDKIYEIAADISNIQFDGTFYRIYTVPKLFYQLWTIFFLPVIHCLLNSKEVELYNAVLSEIANMIPQLNPTNAMSDWEQGARNALKQQYPTTRMNGCWFHYTQAIWRRIQKAGLAHEFQVTKVFSSFMRNIMGIPFLPPDLIKPTYSLLQIPSLPTILSPARQVFWYIDGIFRYINYTSLVYSFGIP